MDIGWSIGSDPRSTVERVSSLRYPNRRPTADKANGDAPYVDGWTALIIPPSTAPFNGQIPHQSPRLPAPGAVHHLIPALHLNPTVHFFSLQKKKKISKII